MKKQKFKILSLNKKSISNLDKELKGGYQTFQNNSACTVCATDFVCDTWASCDFSEVAASCSICRVK